MIDHAMDTATARSNAENKELQGFKRKLNSMSDRLSSGETKDEKLKEACEKFEAVFMGKIWKEMRKNVPKSGYLNNQYEQQYTAMFDKDFSEKLAEGGGIGLGDMLYQQLRSKLETASKSTLPGTGNSTALKTLDEVNRSGSVHGEHLARNERVGENGMPGIPLPKPGISLEDGDFPINMQVERRISREQEGGLSKTSRRETVADSPVERAETMAKIEALARKIEMEHNQKVYVQGATAEEIGKKLAGL